MIRSPVRRSPWRPRSSDWVWKKTFRGTTAKIIAVAWILGVAAFIAVGIYKVGPPTPTNCRLNIGGSISCYEHLPEPNPSQAPLHSLPEVATH